MRSDERWGKIVSIVNARGFVSVRDLSVACGVSDVTIRRDLQLLHGRGELTRTHGGAAATARPAAQAGEEVAPHSSLVDRVDVLVATPVDPVFDRALLERASQKGVPIVAESTGLAGASTLVAVDNFEAARSLGLWAGRYALGHLDGKARLLDQTIPQENTQARSRGFLAGLRESAPATELVLSINSQSTCAAARQLTAAVLAVHPEINVIFAINDATACGAIEACRERGLKPDQVLVLTFGLEGETLREELARGEYCRAAVAMFPEIVGPVCVEAAISVYNDRPLPPQLITPSRVLTPETLGEFYVRGEHGWQLREAGAAAGLAVPLLNGHAGEPRRLPHPQRVGLVVPFGEHEWYRSLASHMARHAERVGIELVAVNAEQHRRDDVLMREREIARVAAEEVAPGDVVILDGGTVASHLAAVLTDRSGITVITNSNAIVDILHRVPGIVLISTGGLIRPGHEAMTGPTAELALRELRADKLFLTASGVSPEFGLSHDDLSEVPVKQAMVRAAREVILLADHTKFGDDSVAQVAPLSQLSKVISDSALPASLRLELSKRGIEVIIAKT